MKPKKQILSNGNISIDDIISQIKVQASPSIGSTYIPNIIEFCDSPIYLDMPNNGINLYPMQRIILKSFYRGQPGNESLFLTDDELLLLKNYNLNNVIEKYESEELFRELVLVLGRRSGKDLMTSLMALYEAMRLLEMPGGSPFKTYHSIAPGNPIYILTVATAAGQAKILFNEMKSRMIMSKYFKDKIGAWESDSIWLLTPEDKLNKQKLIEEGLQTASEQEKGTIVIMSGHSNSDSLLGKRYWCIVYDEVASYKNTGGSSSGERLYSALGPGTSDFVRTIGHDESGLPITQTDSKIISISSPRSESGILFKLHNDAPDTPSRLSFRLPTWKVNLALTERTLRQEHKYMTPTEFSMEFGAEFSGMSGEKFVPDKYVDDAISLGVEMGIAQKEVGIPGVVYYVHIDPASSSHNYALLLLHVEDRIKQTPSKDPKHAHKPHRIEKEKYKLFVIDHIKIWQPKEGAGISPKEIDQYVIDLNKRFRIGLVTYDIWNSDSSIEKLRSKGIPTKLTPFRSTYKMNIYQNLETILINNHLAMPYKGPDAQLLEMELKCLKRIYTAHGFKIKPDKEAHVTTDDLADCLAGACAIASNMFISSYPKSGTANMPVMRGNSAHVWHIGHGSFTSQQYTQISRRLNQ